MGVCKPELATEKVLLIPLKKAKGEGLLLRVIRAFLLLNPPISNEYTLGLAYTTHELLETYLQLAEMAYDVRYGLMRKLLVARKGADDSPVKVGM